MKKTEFKTLMYNGEYVNVNMLDKGIYNSLIPFIYSKDETIESMIERCSKLRHTILSLPETYFKNLKQCQLVTILITEVQS